VLEQRRTGRGGRRADAGLHRLAHRGDLRPALGHHHERVEGERLVQIAHRAVQAPVRDRAVEHADAVGIEPAAQRGELAHRVDAVGMATHGDQFVQRRLGPDFSGGHEALLLRW
jgi:hypothetical protein